jgi:hypothetical protein
MLNEVNAWKLIKSDDAFCLMATGGQQFGDQQFKTVIIAAFLLIRQVKRSSSIFLAHTKTLESGTAKYPLSTRNLQIVHGTGRILGRGSQEFFSGQLPVRLATGRTCRPKNYNGDQERNPFNVQHFHTRKSGSIWTDSDTA